MLSGTGSDRAPQLNVFLGRMNGPYPLWKTIPHFWGLNCNCNLCWQHRTCDMALVCSKLKLGRAYLRRSSCGAIGNKMRMHRNCRNNPGSEWELWEEHQEHLAKCMREIEGTYESCKNSLIWWQGKKDTRAGHMENTLKTNWEHMGKSVWERETEGDRRRETERDFGVIWSAKSSHKSCESARQSSHKTCVTSSKLVIVTFGNAEFLLFILLPHPQSLIIVTSWAVKHVTVSTNFQLNKYTKICILDLCCISQKQMGRLCHDVGC